MSPAHNSRTKDSMVAMVAGVGLNAVAVMLIARLAGPAGRGDMVKLSLIPTGLNVLAGAGLAVSNVLLVAQGKLESRHAVGNSVIWSVLVTGVLAVLAAVTPVGPAVANAIDVELSAVILATATAAFLLIYQQLASVFQGRRDFRTVRNLRIVQGAVLVAGVALAAAFGRLAPVELYAVWICSFGVGAAFEMFTAQAEFGIAAAPREFVRSVRVGVAGMWSQIWDMANFRGDQYLIAAIASPQVLGLYSVGVAVTELVFHLPNAIAQVIFSETASAERTAGESFSTSGAVLVAGLVVSVALIPCAWALGFVLGPGYEQLWLVVAALAPATAALAAARLVGATAMGSGHVWLPGCAAATSLGLTLVLDLALVPALGATGAALGAAAGYVAAAIVLAAATQAVTKTPVIAPVVGGARQLVTRSIAVVTSR